jgi:hypothetical protein
MGAYTGKRRGGKSSPGRIIACGFDKRLFTRLTLIVALCITLILGMSGGAGADDTGPVNPATGVSDSSGACGSRAWSNIPDAFTQNDTYADSNNVQSETTACLKLTNFDFSSIPAGSTIVGITAEADRYMEAAAGTITDGIVRLVRAGTISFAGDNKASGTTWATSDTDTYESYGGASDQWGEAWNLADIQNAGFGVAIAATESGIRADTVRH